jgi:hypothetical protein
MASESRVSFAAAGHLRRQLQLTRTLLHIIITVLIGVVLYCTWPSATAGRALLAQYRRCAADDVHVRTASGSKKGETGGGGSGSKTR